MREELIKLADRVESLSGPDREVDRAIVESVRGKPKPGFQHGRIDHYTASLDAAMSLVPEDNWCEIKGPRKYLHIPTPVPNYWSAHLSGWGERGVMGWGVTPALALTAAALRARAEVQS